jgi:hypothetical protein
MHDANSLPESTKVRDITRSLLRQANQPPSWLRNIVDVFQQTYDAEPAATVPAVDARILPHRPCFRRAAG